MCKNIFKLFFMCIICVGGIGMISCVSNSNVVDSDSNGENEFICVEQGSDLDVGVPIVVANDIPIIEICPPPFEAHVPGESVPEKNPGKPGDSYDNLLQPVFAEDCNQGLLIVKTNVPGVKVSINNRYVGDSDLGIMGIIPRIYILGLSKDGYKEENLWISVGENKKQIFSITMESMEKE